MHATLQLEGVICNAHTPPPPPRLASTTPALQVDTPPAWLRDQLQGAVAANNMQPDADPSMQPKDPSAEHRRLQQQDAQAADLPVATGIRRLLPEEFNATWGLDILDQHALPLDDIYHYTYNGVFCAGWCSCLTCTQAVSLTAAVPLAVASLSHYLHTFVHHHQQCSSLPAGQHS